MQSLSPRRPLVLRLSYVIVVCVLLFIVGAAISVQLSALLPLQLLTRLFPEVIANNIVIYFFDFFGLHVAVLLYIRFTRKEVLPRFFSGYRNNSPGFFLFGLLCGLAANFICIALPLLRADLSFAPGNMSPWAGALLFVCVLVQASAEELLFRGYMLHYLADGYRSPWVGILFGAVMFAAGHLFNFGITPLSFFNILLAGLALALAVYYFGSFWFAIAFHTAWNFCQTFLFGLPNSGQSAGISFLQLTASRQSLFYDTAFGVESTLSASCVYVLMILIELFIIRKYKLNIREELS